MHFGLEERVADLQLMLGDAALWIGFVFSLMIFSLLAGDNLLSRLAQYILVGVSIGYLGALVIQHVLRPRLLEALFYTPLATLVAAPQLWVVFILGLLLCAAGIEQMRAQTPGAPWGQQGAGHPRHVRPWLRQAGTIPAAILLGVGVAVVFIGILQGTFWPLFLHTAASGLNWENNLGLALSSVLILIITTATLLVWAVPVEQITADQPLWVRHLIRWWAAIGKRALWFASGVLFARLLASHLSLLIARIMFLLEVLRQSTAWQWLGLIWRGILGS